MYVAAGLLSFTATAGGLVLANPFARKLGLVDHPGGRKNHDAATPVTGGLALVLGVFLTCFSFGQFGPELRGLGIGALILLVVGWLDDLYDLRWPYRILAQVFAAYAVVAWGGVRVEHLGVLVGGMVHLGWLSLPFNLLAIVGLINAFNMCDGSDGLAGSLGVCSILMLVAGSLYAGNMALIGDLSIVLGALLGFLLFNMRFPWQPRAKAFLGNSGSAILGLVIAWGSFRLTQTPGHPVAPVLAPFLAAPPVIDCLVVMMRRLFAGRSPFAADHRHMHHFLLKAGLSPSKVVGVLCLTSLALGLAAALWLLAHLPAYFLLLAFPGLALTYFIATADRGEFAWLAKAKEQAPANAVVIPEAPVPAAARIEGWWPESLVPPDMIPIPARHTYALNASAADDAFNRETAALVEQNAALAAKVGRTLKNGAQTFSPPPGDTGAPRPLSG